MSLATVPTPTADARLDQLIASQEECSFAAQPASRRAGRAGAPLPGRRRDVELADRLAAGGLAQPRRAARSIYDVDGTEYVDMHGGYGVSLVGHAHPAIVAAVQRAGRRAARTSRSPPRTRSSSPRSSPAASGCRCGGSATRAPRRPWTPST